MAKRLYKHSLIFWKKKKKKRKCRKKDYRQNIQDAEALSFLLELEITPRLMKIDKASDAKRMAGDNQTRI